MDRGERRRRTERIIARRIRARTATTGRLFAAPPADRVVRLRLYNLRVGDRERWTFHAWLAMPGKLRKFNQAHGHCSLCDCEPNPRADQPTLSSELAELADFESPEDRVRHRRRRRKDTKRWCRGKVGVLHVSRWQPAGNASDSQILVCFTCGKHLDLCVHFDAWPRKAACRCPLGEFSRNRGPPEQSGLSSATTIQDCSGSSDVESHTGCR
jgi:hypothetical protein